AGGGYHGLRGRSLAVALRAEPHLRVVRLVSDYSGSPYPGLRTIPQQMMSDACQFSMSGRVPHALRPIRLAALLFLAALCVFEPARAWAAGRIATMAGQGSPGYAGDQGPATNATVANPYGIVRGPDRALYLCEVDDHMIRKIAANGAISTVAGTGQRGYSGDGGPASQATLNEPYEVRFDSRGNMLFV